MVLPLWPGKSSCLVRLSFPAAFAVNVVFMVSGVRHDASACPFEVAAGSVTGFRIDGEKRRGCWHRLGALGAMTAFRSVLRWWSCPCKNGQFQFLWDRINSLEKSIRKSLWGKLVVVVHPFIHLTEDHVGRIRGWLKHGHVWEDSALPLLWDLCVGVKRHSIPRLLLSFSACHSSRRSPNLGRRSVRNMGYSKGIS